MSIVKDWEYPLGEAVAKKAREAGISMEDLLTLKKASHMLEGTAVSDAVGEKLEERFAQLDDRYEEALKKTEKGRTVSTVESGIEELKPLKGYKETEKKLEEAENRRRRMKRNRWIFLAAGIAAVAVLIAWGFISSARKNSELNDEIARIRQLTDDGKYDEAIEAFYSVSNQDGLKNDHYEQLKPIVEKIVEKKAEKDGLSAACKLFEELDKAPGPSVDKDQFRDYMIAQMGKDDYSASDKWEVLTTQGTGVDLEILGVNKRQGIIEAYIEQILSERESESRTDLKEWAKDQCPTIVENTQAMNPDLALRFLYALEQDGCDVNTLFSDGLLIDVPMAGRCSSFLDGFWNLTKKGNPNLNKILPVSVVEKRSDLVVKCETDCTSEEELANQITGMQQDDGHYEVRILTDRLFAMPEGERPASFSECSSLFCMQVCYVHSSTITSEAMSTPTYKSRVDPSTSLVEKSYRPAFTELDVVIAYDLKKDAMEIFDVKYHSPQASDEEWFKQHKTLGYGDSSHSSVLSEYKITTQDMIGESDESTLKDTYGKVISDIEMYRILYGGTEEEATDEP